MRHKDRARDDTTYKFRGERQYPDMPLLFIITFFKLHRWQPAHEILVKKNQGLKSMESRITLGRSNFH